MDAPLKIGIIGPAGRMGKELIHHILIDPSLQLKGGLVRTSSPFLNKDLALIAGLPPMGIEAVFEVKTFLSSVDAVIDFSFPSAIEIYLDQLVLAKKILVVGSTALSAMQMRMLEDAANEIPLIYSPNFSLGIFYLANFSSSLAKKMPPSLITISETHHPTKKDKPSGTALYLLEKLKNTCQALRMKSYRREETVGIHQVTFNFEGETITFTHKAQGREVFALGAIKAAKWLSTKSPGFYRLEDLCQ